MRPGDQSFQHAEERCGAEDNLRLTDAFRVWQVPDSD